MCRSSSEPTTLADVLRRRARQQGGETAYVFLDASGEEAERLSYGELDARVRALAVGLKEAGVAGERVLLLYPPGSEFVVAFLGCLYAGAVAVPAYPPASQRHLPRLRSMVLDARPTLALASDSAGSRTHKMAARLPEMANVAWLTTNEVSKAPEEWSPPELDGSELAFLQYTSGSTADPKGVMITHANLVANEEVIRKSFGTSEDSVIVGWLPFYHDMGLIGNLLQPLYVGAECVLMAPLTFLQQPRRWLEAISRYGGTTSGGPNFAYDLCVNRISEEDRKGLDLSSWQTAFSGAEPVRAETLERFAEAFEPCGFRRRAFYPCYGLAEATLMVSGGDAEQPPVISSFEAEALEQHRVVTARGAGSRRLVGCGQASPGVEVRIVDPEDGGVVSPVEVGEIWVAGASVAAGYWQRPEKTAHDFETRLEEGGPCFLRTGDLGFLEGGELFVTGRIKDLIILRGRNHYPQDLELSAENAHRGLRPGCGAAFAVEAEGEERLVVVYEVARHPGDEPATIAEAVRRAVAEGHEVQAYDVVLVRAGSIAKTSSGKIRRGACRDEYLAGELRTVGRSTLWGDGGENYSNLAEEDASEVLGAEVELDRLALAARPADERPELLRTWLAERFARLARVPMARLDLGRPLTGQGLDSLAAIELASEVETSLGVTLSLADLLAGLSLDEIASRLVGEVESSASSAEEATRGEPVYEYPLSYGQRALWFLHRLAPDSAAYTIAGAARVRTGLDEAGLRRAFEAVVQRHPALRTVFVTSGDQPAAVVRDALAPEVVSVEAPVDPSSLESALHEFAYRPFDLEQGPLVRLGIFRRSEERLLVLSLHHVAVDFWSLAVMLEELGKLYAAETGGAPAVLEPLASTYADYARRQHEELAGAEGERLAAYWHERLRGLPPTLKLPADRPPRGVESFAGAQRPLRLPAGLSKALRRLGQAHEVTPFMTLMAAFQVLLGRLSGQADLAVGAPTTVRESAALAGLVGYFVNPVVLRAELDASAPFGRHLEVTRWSVLGAYAHRAYPFPLLAESLSAASTDGRSPLFQVMLAWQQDRPSPRGDQGGEIPPDEAGLAEFLLGGDAGAWRLGDLSLDPVRLRSGSAQFDLTLSATETANGLLGVWYYKSGLFDAVSVARLSAHFTSLLKAVAENPERRLADLPLLSAGQRQQTLIEWNDPGRGAGSKAFVHELFFACAERFPDAVAVVGDQGSVTYGDLGHRVRRLAGRLRGVGVGPEQVVALCLERSVEMVVALLAVAETGGAYLPLDPEYPADRLRFMLDDARAAVLVSDERSSAVLGPGAANGARLLRIDREDGAPSGLGPATSPHEENAAYVIYTSGSTGTPKGVTVSYGSLGKLIRDRALALQPDDAVLLKITASFDMSVMEIFRPLVAGARLVLARPGGQRDGRYLMRLIRDQRVTVAGFTPSALAPLLEEDRFSDRGRTLRSLGLGAEAVSPELVRRLHADCDAELFNRYGPTEATVFVLEHAVGSLNGDRAVPIGRPITGARVHLADRRSGLVPVGVAGEVLIGGRCLARGYLRRPAQTAASFVPDPFTTSGGRLYRTGDLGRLRHDGEVEFLGRADDQVKIRGFRIELGEVSAALAEHSALSEVTVIDVKAGASRQLAAYVVAAGDPPAASELSAFLADRLPAHMVPAAYVVLERMPVTRAGKVDRRALPSPAWFGGAEYVAPRTPEEEIVAALWRDVLGLEGPAARQVGVYDDFFALGGHSLMATQVLSRLHEAFGVELEVRRLFESPTVSGLAAALEGASPEAPAGRRAPIRAVPRGGPLPASFAQERLWFLDQLEPGSAAYNLPAALKLLGELDVAALAASLEGLAGRHETLRTALVNVAGEPRQRIEPSSRLALPVVDLELLAAAPRATEVRRIVAREGLRPFDLAEAPLMRAALLRSGGGEHMLLLVLHHVVTDGWSMGVLTRELGELYRAFTTGRAPALPELSVQYADYAVWQRGWLAGEELERQLDWWRRRLAGAPPVLELPTDRPRRPRDAARGAWTAIRLGDDLSRAAGELARRRGVTLFMATLAAFQALLGRYSGQSEVVVGSPIAGRGRRELEDLIGFFVNTLALPADLRASSFSELLDQVRAMTLGAYAHQDLPFERLVAELEAPRDLSHSPVFQVLFALQNVPLEAPELPGLALERLPAEETATPFDLSFFLTEEPEGLAGMVRYRRDLFDATSVRRMVGGYERLLASAVADPEGPLAALPQLGEVEQAQLLREWNDVGSLRGPGRRLPYAGSAGILPAFVPKGRIGRQSLPYEDLGLAQLVAGQVALTPDSVALRRGPELVSYAELERRSESLAGRLASYGVGEPGAETTVGICLERGIEMVVTILGVLRAGGVYVPLDPSYPRERLAFLLDDAQARVVVTRAGARDALGPHDAPDLLLDEDQAELDQAELNAAPASGERLAYLIYTSGSTGRPKGVAITHRSAAAFVEWASELFEPRELSAVLAATSINFDLSVFEIFVPLSTGGTVIVATDALELSHLAERDAVTLINTVPSAIAALCQLGPLPATVRTVNLAGEPLRRVLVNEVVRAAPAARVENLYGPSEDTTYSTCVKVPAGTDEELTVGRPLPGTSVYLLDRGLRPVPAGAAAELCLSGDGLARGYLARPALTAASFVPDPFAYDGRRLYRTGDLACYRADGELELLGRIDHQVKVRGFRVELGEVETALAEHPEVDEAVVVARGEGDTKRLVAWLSPAGAEASALSAWLGQRLPAYMVPAAFVALEALPLLPNGKVDRSALGRKAVPALGQGPVGAAPRTALELTLAEIWSEVLGGGGAAERRFGVNEDFFSAGGHSLLVTRVVSRIRDQLGVELPVRALFEAATLADQAVLVERSQAESKSARALIPRLVRDSVELPLSFAQERLWFLAQLDPEASRSYNVPFACELRGPLRVGPLAAAIAALIRRHETLRTRFCATPRGPRQVVEAPDSTGGGLEAVDLAGLADARREAEIERLTLSEARRLFDLEHGPLIVCRLVSAGPERHVLQLTMHHVISDGWSIGVLLRDLEAFYAAAVAGRPATLPELEIRYADYAVWQRKWLTGDRERRQADFWREHLRGAPTELELPFDRPRPKVRTGRGGVCPLPPVAHGPRAAAFAGGHGATPFMVLLAAFQASLMRWSSQRDLVVGSPIAGRTRRELEDLIGFFVNTLALRADLRGRPQASFTELLAATREVTLAAYAHQDLPFERLVEELAPERHLAFTPIFQVLFTLRDAARPSALFGLESESLVLAGLANAKFDLTLQLEETPRGLAGGFEYDRDLFDATTVERFGRRFRRLLAAMLDEPRRPLLELPQVGAAERQQVVFEWNDNATSLEHESVVSLFARQAGTCGDAVALAAAEGQLSYAELDARADRLARRLCRLGVRTEAAVGLCVERSARMVVATLAIVKAGGFYVPLDPEYPRGRLSWMLAETGAAVVLAAAGLAGRLPIARGTRLVALEDEADAVAAKDPAPLPDTAAGDQLAYVMYTSGSTGRPKGVAVPHRAIVRLVHKSGFARLDRGQVFLQLAPVSFDAATLEIWAPLAVGGRLVVYPAGAVDLAELAQELLRQRVTTLWLTAGLFHRMVEDHLAGLRGLTQLLAGGDVLSVPHVERARAALDGTTLINGYGPTENTTFSCCHPIRGPLGTSVPIGRPISSSPAWVVDAGEPVPIGAVGELFVGGAGLARGYFGSPRRTALRFVPDPHTGAAAGSRVYATGDRVAHLFDGRVSFFGRADTQVKIRGFRIEPGEVETVLKEVPGVNQAVVVVRPGPDGAKRLVAYVVARQGAGGLRAALAARLPDHMVPSAFVELGELPLNPNGKVDRKALPAPEWGLAADIRVAPRTPQEEILAGIWGELLGIESVGVHDDFFELGGHSLLATQVSSRLRQQLGVELPVRALFEAPTVAALAAAVEHTRHGAERCAAVPRVPREVLPEGSEGSALSYAQERLWFLDQVEQGDATYNVDAAIELRGRLDVAAFSAALDAVVRRHETLRTTFRDQAGKPIQVIAPPGSCRHALPVADLAALSRCRRDTLVRRLSFDEKRRPFDLARGPLLRTMLLRLGEGGHVVLLTFHHIISDGWSMGVFLRELGALYRAATEGAASPLGELTIQYADFAAWQRGWLSAGELERQLEYWRGRLHGAPEVIDLPADRPRPAVASQAGRRLAVTLPPRCVEAVRRLTRDHAVSVYMTLLAGFLALLNRLSGQRDVLLGSPIAGRTRDETEPLIGFFVNTLVIRSELGTWHESFGHRLGRLRETMLEAYAHQDLPFEKLVAELAPRRSSSYSPIFQVMFAHRVAAPSDTFPGLDLVPLEVEATTAKFDLALSLVESDDLLAGQMGFRIDLFDPSTIQRFCGYFIELLESAAADPGREIAGLNLVGAAERHQLVGEWNAAEGDYPGAPQATLANVLGRRAARCPEAVALVDPAGQQLSYHELERRGTHLAAELSDHGAGPDDLVGVALERSLEMIVGLWGVLGTGAGYLPIDPESPAERTAYLLGDAGRRFNLPVILTQERLRERLPEFGGEVLCPDRFPVQGQGPRDRRFKRSHPGNLAYVIYTSGSTGKPKGVMITHRALVNRMVWVTAREATATGTLLQRTSLVFDVSVAEIFAPLVSGGRLVLLPPGAQQDVAPLLRHLALHEVHQVSFLPSQLLGVLDHGGLADCRSLRAVLTGAEEVPAEVLPRVAEQVDVMVFNRYGLSETTISMVSWKYDGKVRGTVAPIGFPIAGSRVFVLDAVQAPVPIGVPGEIAIGGVCLARGYVGRPGETASRFIPDPLSVGTGAGERMYKTGDLARHLAVGEIEFLGRIDSQVQIRGFRVELGEVAAVLSRHPGVREVAVVDLPDSATRRLAAYFVPQIEDEPSAGQMRGFLREALPEYMVPQAFVALAELPLTVGGKVDRKALPAPSWGDSEAYVAPRTSAEELVAGVWQEVLEADRVSATDDFFDLGGHSLLATQVISRLSDSLGIEIKVRQLFESPTVEALAARLEGASPLAGTAVAPPIVALPAGVDRPASFAQERLWFLDQMTPGDVSYNMPAAVRLSGHLDAAALSAAVALILRRHEVLRTRFEVRGSDVVQVVVPPREQRMPRVDLDGLTAAARDAEVRRQARDEARRPFDLARGPLVRTALVRLSESEHVVLLNFHHVICDGWSIGVFIRELASFYQAGVEVTPSRMPALPVQYGDFSAWQRKWLGSGELERQLDYWRGHLRGAPELIDLPIDRPRPATIGQEGSTLPLALSEAAVAALGDLARSCGATLYIALLSGFVSLLHRLSGQRDVLVGTPIAGRNRSAVEPLIGFFVNTLVIRSRLDGQPGFRRFFEDIRETTLAAYAHQDVPFEKLVAELAPRRSRSHSPLFQVMVAHHPAPRSFALTGLDLEPIAPDVTTAKFDLALGLVESPEKTWGHLDYRTELFDAVTVRRFRSHFRNLLENAAADPDRPLPELPLLAAAEHQQLVVEWNATAEAEEPAVNLYELVARQVQRRGDAVALLDDRGVFLSYRGLDESVVRLAIHLARRGVGPEVRVGSCLERSPEAVVTLLAVLAAGGAYVTLDPSYPVERLAFMLEDSGAAVLVSRRGQLPEGLAFPEEKVLWLGDLDQDFERGIEIPRYPVPSLRDEERSRHLAYVIYTSGSTGRPKGVAVPHRGVINTLAAARELFRVSSASRWLQAASLAFDASVLEIGCALTSGATLCLARRETLLSDPEGTLRRWGVTNMAVVPSFLAGLGEAELPELEAVVVGGEACPGELAANRAQRHRLFNVYAPTELSIFNTGFVHPADGTVFPGSPPVGRPIRGNRVYLLSREGRPVPIGVHGELCGAGQGVVRGYLERPALTAERFIPDPFAGSLGGRLYRTGDLTRCRPDGDVEYLGRTDHQVKLRGVRIELGEVEAALAECPGVRQAVAVVRDDSASGPVLVGYVVAGEEVRNQALRDRLRELLPEAMVPGVFVRLEELPTMPTGKLDRRSLPAPDAAHRDLATPYVAPREGLGQRLAELWQSILGQERIGVDDDFFELGGNSLQAALLIRQLQEGLGEVVYVVALFEAPTIGALAGYLEQTYPEAVQRWSSERLSERPATRCLVGLQPGTEGHVPLCVVHPVFGEVQLFRHLAAALGSERPVYGLRAVGLEAGEEAVDDVGMMADRYLEEVVERWPRGPYALAGSSMGGVVAWEMARRLRQRGEAVALLAFLDTADPHYAPPQPGDLEIEAAMLEYLAANGSYEAALSRLRQADSDDERLDALLTAGRVSGRAPASADRDWLRRVLELVRRHGDALRAYRPEPYDGDLVHVRAAETAKRLERPEVSGWAALCCGVEVAVVPGDHLSVHFPPQVTAVAEILRPALECADSHGLTVVEGSQLPNSPTI